MKTLPNILSFNDGVEKVQFDWSKRSDCPAAIPADFIASAARSVFHGKTGNPGSTVIFGPYPARSATSAGDFRQRPLPNPANEQVELL
jgi:hypothetical protein